jgi:hypothetical protein
MKANNFLLVTKKDAQASGLTKYFTGVACKRGHMTERRTSSSDCVECSKIRQQTEQNRQHKKDHYEKNKEQVLTRAKNNYEQNKVEKIAYSIEYQRKNSKKIYQRNKVALEQKIKDSPWLTMHLRLRSGISQALRRTGNSQKPSRTMDITGCSHAQLKEHIEKQFLKGMTWGNRDQWHIDHITPISKATCEQDVLALYHFTNLRPMWAADNIRKSNKEIFLI